jgi:hypothetical protein
MKPVRIAGLLVLAAVASPNAVAQGQTVGTFKWQLLPYCNVLTLTVIQMGGTYTLNGTDDQCGAPTGKASAVGIAFQNPTGSIGMGVTLVTPTGGTPVPVHVDASIVLGSLSGTWRDSTGNSGSFIFTPLAGIPGAPRPVSPSGLAPGSITAIQLAPSSVGAAQLAPAAVTATALADDSITAAKIADRPRAAISDLGSGYTLSANDGVANSLSLTVPSSGKIVVTASGYFNLNATNLVNNGVCSLTTGQSSSTLDGVHVLEYLSLVSHRTPFSLTRGFTVAPGPVTFNLVCRLLAGDVSAQQTVLTAQFYSVP